MLKETRTIYLIDGSAYIHRAYHAIRNLANSKGLPTNAVFGFTKMLLKLIQDKKPEYLAMVFDAKGPTFRHEIYDQYKANRPPMPEDMVVQLPFIKQIVENLNIPILEMAGFEADDIIGTLARKCEKNGFQVIMVTGDKDFRQLITPSTCMWDTMKDRITDYSTIKAEYGFEPEKFIDVMGLSGDTSDNIPGVPGIGEKTAIGLIQTYADFENVFAQVEEITKKKLNENLRKFKDQAILSKRLVTIDRFVPIDETPEDLKMGDPENEALATIFREMEFRDLWDSYASRKEVKTDYRLCLTTESLLDLVKLIKKKRLVAVDTETTSTDPLQADLVGISFSCEAGKAFYLPLKHLYLGVPEQPAWIHSRDILREIFEDEKILKVGHNIKYDAEVLKRHGAPLSGIHFDTMIASYVINPGLRQHSLDHLAQHYLDHKMISYEEVVGKGKNKISFSGVDVARACEYSGEDADMTLRLMQVLQKKLASDQNETLFSDMEMTLLPVLMDMEMTGIKIDIAFFKRMSTDFSQQMKALEKEVFQEAGMDFNINSPRQLGHVLFEKLQLPVQGKTQKTKNYSTDVKVLKKLAVLKYRIPDLLLRYRTLSKLKSTYLDALVKLVNPTTGRVHTSYNQTVAATGRLSSSNPNMQNIPIRGEDGREIRKGFVSEKDCYLVAADYSQIELRVFAHYSNDAAFMEAFQKDEDIHAKTAAEIMGKTADSVTPDMRRIAKAVNFGIIYGMGPKKLSEELGIELDTAKAYISAYYETYTGVLRYKESMIKTAKRDGFVTTLFNRRRYLPDIQHSNRMIRAEAERMAINTPIQGTAADLIKKAMINIHERLSRERLTTRMLLQVHDELVFEVPENEMQTIVPLIREEMEGVFPLRVPLKVDINNGRNWDEAH